MSVSLTTIIVVSVLDLTKTPAQHLTTPRWLAYQINATPLIVRFGCLSRNTGKYPRQRADDHTPLCRITLVPFKHTLQTQRKQYCQFGLGDELRVYFSACAVTAHRTTMLDHGAVYTLNVELL